MERLTGLDASFLYLETSTMLLNIGFAVKVDPRQTPGWSFQWLFDHVARRAQTEPAFRRRLLDVPFGLDHPRWVEDPEFDALSHMRHVALPAPGDDRELGAMVGRIMSVPLDRSRPLSEVWAIEGGQDGCWTFVMKLHHASVDGVAAAGLLLHLLDTEAQTAHPQPLPGPPAPPLPGGLALLRHALAERACSPLRLPRLLGRSARNLAALTHTRLRARDENRSWPLGAPRTHFNRAIGRRRNVVFARVPLADAKRIKAATGTTINDVVLAACGGALRRYLLQRGDLPARSLTAMVRVSVRTGPERDDRRNRISGMWSGLGTDLHDPLERLRLINADTLAAKRDQDAIGADMLQDWAEFNAPTVFQSAVRWYTKLRLADRLLPVHNVIVSNVPGPRRPLFLAGAPLLSIHPMGPVMEAVGLNMTVMSYLENLDFSFVVDAAQVPDAWDLAGHVAPAFAELLQAACPEGLEALPAGPDPTARAFATPGGPRTAAPAPPAP